MSQEPLFDTTDTNLQEVITTNLQTSTSLQITNSNSNIYTSNRRDNIDWYHIIVDNTIELIIQAIKTPVTENTTSTTKKW